MVSASFAWVVAAQAQRQQPPFATTKVDGTNNVYVFRYGSHQSMFVVTTAGVIATDPIAYGRPQAATTYVDEIKKVSNQPIKYLIYSHHHFDHIAGGKPFKDAGATVLTHRRAAERLVTYVGLNHSDSTVVMRLPAEKILFAVDFIPVASVPGRGMIDSYPLEWEDSVNKVLAMDWDRFIPGHPGPGGRLGTKQDAQNLLTFLQDASATVKEAAQAGQCWETAEKETLLRALGPRHLSRRSALTT